MKKTICLLLACFLCLAVLPACRKLPDDGPRSYACDSGLDATVFAAKNGQYTSLYLPLYRLVEDGERYLLPLAESNRYVFGEDAVLLGEGIEALNGGTVDIIPTRLDVLLGTENWQKLSKSEREALENAYVWAFALRFSGCIAEEVLLTGFEVPVLELSYSFNGLRIVPEALPEAYLEGSAEQLLGLTLPEQYREAGQSDGFEAFFDVYGSVEFSAARVSVETPGWSVDAGNVGPLGKQEWAEWQLRFVPESPEQQGDTVILTLVYELERPSGEKIRCYQYPVSTLTAEAFALQCLK